MSGSLNNIHHPKRAPHCLVCKSASTGTILYVCESGHVVCNKCQNKDASTDPNQTHNECEQRRHSARRSKKDLKRSAPKRNLACGDHEDPAKEPSLITKNNESDFKTSIEYKNLNYCDSNSSSDTTVKVNLNTKKNRRNLTSSTSQRREVIPRPIICPHCQKMITTTTLYQHFQFDHSKLPSMHLPFNLSQAVQIKISNISPEPECVAFFMPQRLYNSVTFGDNYPLLLMTARIDTDQIKSRITKCECCRPSKSLSNVETQTDFAFANSTPGFERNRTFTDENVKRTVAAGLYQTNEVLVIWIVKLEDEDNIYNIALSDEDKTYRYSYTGKAIDIRDEQVALKIYHRAECLIMHGQAINRVISDQYLLAYVTMIPKIENKVI